MNTFQRSAVSLSGPVVMKVTRRRCIDHASNNMGALESIVPSGSRFDLKVMITTGILRWLMDYQRDEIRILLEGRGIHISTGEISALSVEFLLRFYCIHRRHIPEMEVDGCVLHLDGTGESGDEIVFTAREGRTGMCIDSTTMQSENPVPIGKFLESLRMYTKDPAAVVRDMSKSIRGAVSEVFPETTQLVCHYHFVKDLGKDVFPSYSGIRSAMVSTKALARISKNRPPDRGSGIRYAEGLWSSIASEYILHPRTVPSRFPFLLPYVQVLERCLDVDVMCGRIISWNASHLIAVPSTLDLHAAIGKIIHNSAVMERYAVLSRSWMWFESVRKSLGVSRDLSSSESSKEAADIAEISSDIENVLRIIEEEGEFAGGELKRISRIFGKSVDDHRDELLSPVYGKDGNMIDVVRHNGVEEIGHRWSRMHVRRRTGRSATTSEMTMYGALTAVLSNVNNAAYIDKVLKDMDFLREFSSITDPEMEEARRLIRPNPRRPIIRKDKYRKGRLESLVSILEKSYDPQAWEINQWVESIKI